MNGFLCSFFCLILVLPEVAGCASPSLPPPTPLPSDEQRSQFGRVGVVSVSSRPEAIFEVPAVGRGAGAAQGAAEGAFYTAGEFVATGCGEDLMLCPLVIVLMPAVAGVGAIVGGIIGAADAVPSEIADRAEREIRRALMDAEPQASLLRDIQLTARLEGLSTVEEVSESSPGSVGQEHDYEAIREQGIDTLLEVAVIRVGLVGQAGKGGSDPLLTLALQASVRVTNVNTWTDIYPQTKISNMRPPRNFSEWGRNGAVLLGEEIDKIIADTARMIVEEIFLVVR